MLLLILLIFVALPIAEIAVLVKLGGGVGWPLTLGLVFGTGLAGAAVARMQGWRSALRIRRQMAAGELPAAEVFDGLLIGAAGLLLLLPGAITDVLGLALLVPPVRKFVRRAAMSWVRRRFEVQVIASSPPPGDEIIDARVIDARIVE